MEPNSERVFKFIVGFTIGGLIVVILSLLSGCGGYQAPKDQCIWDGTECEHAENETSTAVATGPQGDRGVPGPRGEPGPAGSPGPAGRDGTDGSSCTSTQTSNGAVISCTDGTSVAILNGSPGEDGEDATPPTTYSIVSVYDPCGQQGQFDEILLRTYSGNWIAHFSHGNKQFLTVLTPGTYVTTDNTGCKFTLDSAGQIVNEHN